MGIEVGLKGGGGGGGEGNDGSTNFTGSWIEQYRAADMTFFLPWEAGQDVTAGRRNS